MNSFPGRWECERERESGWKRELEWEQVFVAVVFFLSGHFCVFSIACSLC